MAGTSTLTIATSNVQWATPGTDRGSLCAAVLADARADIIVPKPRVDNCTTVRLSDLPWN